jgi:hypothetical protein
MVRLSKPSRGLAPELKPGRLPTDRYKVSGSVHLRAIVIAGALAVLALALGFVTLLMNQTASKASPHVVLPLHAGRHSTAANGARVDPNFAAALAAGLPRSVAKGLARTPVAVVELTSHGDPVAQLARQEAELGAAFGAASFVVVDVDRNGGDIERLTRLLGHLPDTPATLVYSRPATLTVTLTGFNDRTIVEQAVQNAALAAAAARATALATAPNWAARANGLCRTVYAELDNLGGLGRPSRLVHNKARFESVATGFLAQLQALKPPAGRATEVRKLNALLAQSFSADDAMVAAASRHDAPAVAAARAHAASFQGRIVGLERRLGASACVDAAA